MGRLPCLVVGTVGGGKGTIKHGRQCRSLQGEFLVNASDILSSSEAQIPSRTTDSNDDGFL